MHGAAHEVADGIVHQSVTGNRILAGKGGGYDVQVVMTAAVARAGMAGVPCRVVLDIECVRLQYGQSLT